MKSIIAARKIALILLYGGYDEKKIESLPGGRYRVWTAAFAVEACVDASKMRVFFSTIQDMGIISEMLVGFGWIEFNLTKPIRPE
jgi:hypothetical protein